MFEYKRVLVRIRRGDSDRAIRRAGLMGHGKAKGVSGILDRSQISGKPQVVRLRIQKRLSPASSGLDNDP